MPHTHINKIEDRSLILFTLSTEFAEFSQPYVLHIMVLRLQNILLFFCLDGEDVIRRTNLWRGSDSRDFGKVNQPRISFLADVLVIAKVDRYCIGLRGKQSNWRMIITMKG